MNHSHSSSWTEKVRIWVELNTSILILLNVFASSLISSSTFRAHVHMNGNSTKLCMNWYGILSRITGKCCFNFIRNPESTGNVVGSRRFAQAAPKGIFNLGKPAVWFRNPRDQATIRDARFYISAQEASYCAILSHAAKAAAKRRFWCRQSQLTFRTMKSTSAVHLPTAKSPSSIFAGEPVDGQTFVPLNSKRNSLTHIFSWYHLASVFVILHIFLKLSINCRLPISPYEIRQFCWFVFKNSDLARP